MSEIHKMCVRAHESIETSQVEKAIVRLNEKQVKQVQSLFKAAHSCVKQYKSFKDYEWLCEFIESTGSDIGHNYGTDKQAKLFVTYMAQNIRNKVAEKLSICHTLLLHVTEQLISQTKNKSPLESD